MPINRSSSAVAYHGTVSNSAVDLTALPGTPFTVAQVNAASRLTISCETGALRLFWDNQTSPTAPSTSTGMTIPANNFPWVEIIGNNNIRNLQFIRSSSTDCVCNMMLEND